ncbi:MAG: NAD(P)-dependent oxidoreductase, partial [Nocardioides kribbensis]
DYAAATTRVLADVAAGDGAEHVGAAYELSGDHAWDAEELVAALGEVLGREVTLRAVDTDTHVAALRSAGLDEGTAGFVAGLDAAIAQGALAATPGDLSRLAGRPTTPLVDALRAMA